MVWGDSLLPFLKAIFCGKCVPCFSFLPLDKAGDAVWQREGLVAFSPDFSWQREGLVEFSLDFSWQCTTLDLFCGEDVLFCGLKPGSGDTMVVGVDCKSS